MLHQKLSKNTQFCSSLSILPFLSLKILAFLSFQITRQIAAGIVFHMEKEDLAFPPLCQAIKKSWRELGMHEFQPMMEKTRFQSLLETLQCKNKCLMFSASSLQRMHLLQRCRPLVWQLSRVRHLPLTFDLVGLASPDSFPIPRDVGRGKNSKWEVTAFNWKKSLGVESIWHSQVCRQKRDRC